VPTDWRTRAAGFRLQLLVEDAPTDGLCGVVRALSLFGLGGDYRQLQVAAKFFENDPYQALRKKSALAIFDLVAAARQFTKFC
jgi:hypothetical protein